MDRADLSSAIIQEMHGVVEEALEAVVPEMLTADLATLEQQAQQVGRVLLGQLITRVAAGHAQLLPRPVCCAHCGGKLMRQERLRQLVGLVGDYELHRAYFWCAACQQGAAPLDETLGLPGHRGRLSSGPAGHRCHPSSASRRHGVTPSSCDAASGDGPRRPAPRGTSQTYASPASAYLAPLRRELFCGGPSWSAGS
jgi:hypothetical protein